MDARWLENENIAFYRKEHYFLLVIIVSRTYHSVTNGLQTSNERLKMCSSF